MVRTQFCVFEGALIGEEAVSEAVTRGKSLLVKDARQPCKVMYPLGEVLLLAAYGTRAACNDYNDICPVG